MVLLFYVLSTMTTNAFEDLATLDALYERLGWNKTDELTFLIEGNHIVIRNLFQEQRQKPVHIGQGHPLDNT